MRPLQRFLYSPLRSAASFRPSSTSALRPFHPFNTILPPSTVRFQAAVRKQSTNPTAPSKPLPSKPAPHRNPDEPIYQLTFTCRACTHRSSHTISKQGYHHGTVLITCPGCKNRHLISDHLHIFSDKSITVEDIMRQKGEEVQRGSITPEGDVEFWAQEAKAFGEEEAGATGDKP